MSKYTTELRFICENYAGKSESEGLSKVSEIIALARPKVFDFSYPIFDESYRSVLETKILKHFYTREIGAETVGLWKMWLDTRLNEVMPYYNQLYNSAKLEFNPLLDTDITTTRKVDSEGSKDDNGTKTNERTASGNNNGNNNGVYTRENTGENNENNTNNTVDSRNENSDKWNLYSDTPQGALTGMMSNNEKYLTNATNDTLIGSSSGSSKVEGSNTGTYSDNSSESNNYNYNSTFNDSSKVDETNVVNSTFANTEDYIEHITGKRSAESYSKMLKEFRTTFINVDTQVIESLSDLFMNLW